MSLRKFAIIAKIRYNSENHYVRKFRKVCEIFAMSNSEIFFLKQNKLINK